MIQKNKLVRITTIPISLDKLLNNQLQFMQQYFDVVAVSSNENELKKIADSQGVAYKAINMTRKITPLQDFISVIKLFLFLYKTKPAIVHTHTPKAGIVGMLAAKLAGVPHRLHTVAGLPLMESTGVKRKILNFVEKFTYSCATQVYPNSNGLYKFIIENNFTSPSKLKVLGNGSSNGINTNFFSLSAVSNTKVNSLRENLNIGPDDFVFIFVGRLVTDKGINELIIAFTELQIKHKNVKLLLVGPLESELDPLHENTLQQIEFNKAIITTGYQADVRPYFALSNCLVFPSYREGFPNVVMQAGAMGLPVIATNINGCNEIIVPNVNGILIPVKNSDSINKAMEKMLIENVFSDFSTNSRRLIVERYEQSYIWNQILNEYNKILKHV